MRTGRERLNNALNDCILEISPEKSPNTDRRSRHSKKHGTLSTVLREVSEIQSHSQKLFSTPGKGSGPSNGNTPIAMKLNHSSISSRQGPAPRFNYSFIDLRSPKVDEKNDRNTPPF